MKKASYEVHTDGGANSCYRNFQRMAESKVFDCAMEGEAVVDKHEVQKEGVDSDKEWVHWVVDTMVLSVNRMVDRRSARNQHQDCGNCYRRLDNPKHIQRIPVDHCIPLGVEGIEMDVDKDPYHHHHHHHSDTSCTAYVHLAVMSGWNAHLGRERPMGSQVYPFASKLVSSTISLSKKMGHLDLTLFFAVPFSNLIWPFFIKIDEKGKGQQIT